MPPFHFPAQPVDTAVDIHLPQIDPAAPRLSSIRSVPASRSKRTSNLLPRVADSCNENAK